MVAAPFSTFLCVNCPVMSGIMAKIIELPVIKWITRVNIPVWEGIPTKLQGVPYHVATHDPLFLSITKYCVLERQQTDARNQGVGLALTPQVVLDVLNHG